MTYGTFTNTYLVGRKIVPFVTAPAEQNHSDRRRTGDSVQEKGTYGAYGVFSALLFGPPSPKPTPPPSPTPASETSHPRDQHRLRSLEVSRPPRQDVQINYLDTLAIFVKQTTYLAILPARLATLPAFGHLARSLLRVKEIPRRRNVTSSVRRRFATPGLNSLSSLSSHISTGNTTPALPPRPMGQPSSRSAVHPRRRAAPYPRLDA
jgi:hypothetical protein